MRLINTETLQLEEFFGAPESIPAYAILSHTWGDEEASLRDVTTLPIDSLKRMQGWRKIEGFCQTINAEESQDRIRYAWVDTCCIDKTSSAELSEAINSMFPWYQNAHKCFVFLADVLADGQDRPDDQLKASRWFKRGWTLQELLAPRNVAFYDRSWQYIGDKVILASVVAAITDIDPQIISNELEVFTASVAARMSWAAGRLTTRVEDIAYCLLGIFDINMPLLYGEGVKAFIRLQDEILKRHNDQSLFAWSYWPHSITTEHPTMTSINWWNSSPYAPLPGYFKLGGRIHSYPVKGLPMVSTNTGVQLTATLLGHESGNPGKSWAVLECCYSDDILSSVAILLREQPEGSGCFVRDSLQPERIPIRLTEKAPIRTITLLKRTENERDAKGQPLIEPWCLIRGSGVAWRLSRYHVVHAEPADAYQKASQVFFYRRFHPRASAVVFWRKSDAFVLAIRIPHMSGGTSLSQLPEISLTRLPSTESESIEDCTKRILIASDSSLGEGWPVSLDSQSTQLMKWGMTCRLALGDEDIWAFLGVERLRGLDVQVIDLYVVQNQPLPSRLPPSRPYILEAKGPLWQQPWSSVRDDNGPV